MQNNIAAYPAIRSIRTFYGMLKTSSRRIETPFGFFMSSPMSSGNNKLDKLVLIFDLPAVTTCLNSFDCRHFCYATKAQKQYPGVRAKRYSNYYLAKFHLSFLESELDKQLTRSRKPYVRIHSSGDFLSQAYLDMWARLAAKHTEKTFYFYTKVFALFDFSSLISLHNVNMVESILPNGHINFDDAEKILPMADALNVPVCPYGMNREQLNKYYPGHEEWLVTNSKGEEKAVAHCGKGCTLCMHRRHVAFIKH